MATCERIGESLDDGFERDAVVGEVSVDDEVRVWPLNDAVMDPIGMVLDDSP